MSSKKMKNVVLKNVNTNSFKIIRSRKVLTCQIGKLQKRYKRSQINSLVTAAEDIMSKSMFSFVLLRSSKELSQIEVTIDQTVELIDRKHKLKLMVGNTL